MLESAVEETPRAQIPGGARASLGRWKKIVVLCAVVLLVILFYLSGLSRYASWDSVRANLDSWQAQVAQNLPAALLVFFLAYFAVTALSLPIAALLSLVAGALFGRWLGTGIVSLASTLGATAAFLMSRYVFREWVRARFGSRLAAIDRGIERDGAYYLFTLRLVPVVPFFLINLGMGLTRLPVRTFAVVSWAGMLLGTFLYVNAGTALASLDSPSDILSVKVLVSLALLGVVPLVVRKLVQWRVR